MKKVSIVLILIFTFSLISFAEELKITNDNSTLNIYDDSVNFTHKYHDQ